MAANRSGLIVDDWKVLGRFLPAGWKGQARRLGALRRARQIRGPTLLLRALLVHLAGGCSLVESAARLRQAGWCRISSVALFQRLQAAEHWLRWLAQQLWTGPAVLTADRRRGRAVDGTLVREAGRTGSVWRVHFSLDLTSFQCDYFELTDERGGETFGRYVFVWASLPSEEYGPEAVLELYRARWLIEIAFKRMKSLFGLGQLPKRVDASARAWLHGKLFVALLVERLIRAAKTVSPWGYPLHGASQPLARDAVHAS